MVKPELIRDHLQDEVGHLFSIVLHMILSALDRKNLVVDAFASYRASRATERCLTIDSQAGGYLVNLLLGNGHRLIDVQAI